MLIKYESPTLGQIIFVILFLITVLILCSCQDRNYSVVRIDLNETCGQPIVEVERIICLETNDDALIGEVHKIRYHKGNYYVMDLLVSRNLFLFDSLGNYVASLQRGRGPSEVEYLTEFFIDEVNDYVYVYQPFAEELNVYDLQLNFLYSEIHENLKIRRAELINSDTLLINWPKKSGSGKSEIYELYSLYVLSEKRYLTSFMNINESITSLGPTFPISVHKGRVLLSKSFHNFLYTINLEDPMESLEPKKEYYFDFGRLAISEEDLNTKVSSIFDKSRAGKKIVPFYSISENANYISFNFSLFGKDNFMIYSKETSKYYYSADLFDAGLLPVSRLNNALSPNRFLAFAQPEDVVQFANANSNFVVLEEVSVFDNPCLIVFSLVENNKQQ
jgi:hypothetical protein